MIGVHVEVHVDARTPQEPATDGGVPPGFVSLGAEAPVDLLHMVRDLAPVPGAVPAGAHELSSQSWLADQPLELPREGDRIARREQQASLAVSGELLIERQMGSDRDSLGCEALANQPGGHPGPPGRDAEDVRTGDQLLGRGLARPDGADPLPQAASDSDLSGVRKPDRRLPVEAQRQAAERPQEEAKGSTLLLEAESDPHRAILVAPRPAAAVR